MRKTFLLVITILVITFLVCSCTDDGSIKGEEAELLKDDTVIQTDTSQKAESSSVTQTTPAELNAAGFPLTLVLDDYNIYSECKLLLTFKEFGQEGFYISDTSSLESEGEKVPETMRGIKINSSSEDVLKAYSGIPADIIVLNAVLRMSYDEFLEIESYEMFGGKENDIDSLYGYIIEYSIITVGGVEYDRVSFWNYLDEAGIGLDEYYENTTKYDKSLNINRYCLTFGISNGKVEMIEILDYSVGGSLAYYYNTL